MDSLKRWLKFDLKYATKEQEANILWTTIFDSIQRGENDVFINYATITPERSANFDLTVPYYREGFGMILEVPLPLPRWQSILFPFSWWVWGAIILSMSCSAITYHLLDHMEEPSFITNFIIIMQSLLSNPMDTVPKKRRMRNFLLVWWLGSWFINISYTCNLIAVLTVPVFPTKLQTALDISKSSYKLCMLDYGEFVEEALAESKHPVLSALSKILDMVPPYDTWEHIGQEQCIKRVLVGTHAHIETYSYVKILYNKLGHGAKVYSFQEQLYLGYLAYAVQKNAPWKYKFDVGMQLMLEAGLIQKWYNDAMDDF
ncbi:ionotropic receptor 21a-like [Palaemon carinicauda]|uniref:ionotropic receptor 21a-like n=1 Tax=Palaemon carinicauda TaxID=392227 RepID=UPI0035B60E91